MSNNTNTITSSTSNLHFALLNASRANTSASKEDQKKKRSTSSVTDAEQSSTTGQPTSTSTDSGATSTGQPTNASDSGSSPPLTPHEQKIQKLYNWAESATVETSNFWAIMVVLLIMVSMMVPGAQLKGLGQIATAGQKVTNDLTKMMGYIGDLEGVMGTSGLGTGYFNASTPTGQANLGSLEKACQAAADLFYSNPTNQPLQNYAVSYQGQTYVPLIVYDSSTHTASVEWVNPTSVSGLSHYEQKELTNPASDLQLLMCAEFQYEADSHYSPNNPGSGPSAASLQQKINQSFSALMSVVGYGVSNTYGGWSIFQYMITIGTAVNKLEPVSGSFRVISEQSIDNEIFDQSSWRVFPTPSGGVPGSIAQDFTHMLNSWVAGYQANNNPNDSSKYQQGSTLDHFQNDLQNVQTTGINKMQDVTVKSNSILQEYQNNMKTCQSAISMATKGLVQTIINNSRSQ